MATDKLDTLYDLLTDEMIKQLQARSDDEPVPAAVLSVIVKFLKDNHYEASDDEPAAEKLAELLKDVESRLPEGESL